MKINEIYFVALIQVKIVVESWFGREKSKKIQKVKFSFFGLILGVLKQLLWTKFSKFWKKLQLCHLTKGTVLDA